MVVNKKTRKELWKEYLEALYDSQEILEKSLNNLLNYYFKEKRSIKISEAFDLRKFLKSYTDVYKTEIIWPKDTNFLKQYEAFKNGKCKTLDVKVRIASKSNKEYDVVLTYIPYKIKDDIVFFPESFIHQCPFLEYQWISLKQYRIYCKHIYTALRVVADYAKKFNIPIDSTISFFIFPNILDSFLQIEKSKIKKEEKLLATTNILIGILYLNSYVNKEMVRNFIFGLYRLNKTISYLSPTPLIGWRTLDNAKH